MWRRFSLLSCGRGQSGTSSECGRCFLSIMERRMMPLRPDPDFEDFARDCIRLAGEERSPGLRSRLLVLAREWMHAAIPHHVTPPHSGSAERMDANPGKPWSEMDLRPSSVPGFWEHV